LIVKQEFIGSVNSDFGAKFSALGNLAWDFLTSEPFRITLSAWLLY